MWPAQIQNLSKASMSRYKNDLNARIQEKQNRNKFNQSTLPNKANHDPEQTKPKQISTQLKNHNLNKFKDNLDK